MGNRAVTIETTIKVSWPHFQVFIFLPCSWELWTMDLLHFFPFLFALVNHTPERNLQEQNHEELPWWSKLKLCCSTAGVTGSTGSTLGWGPKIPCATGRGPPNKIRSWVNKETINNDFPTVLGSHMLCYVQCYTFSRWFMVKLTAICISD